MSQGRDAAPARSAPEGAFRRTPSFVLFADEDVLAQNLDRREGGAHGGDRRSARSRARPGPVAPVGFRDLCHDLRQPVLATAVLAAGLEKEAGLSPEGRRRLHDLKKEVERLSCLLTHFLQPPEPELVDICALLRRTVAGLRHVIPAEVELVLGRHALVTGDPVLLSRVLTNLLQNAGHAASRSGRVRATVACGSGEVVITVENTVGPADDEPSGFGLGLTIVQAVVAAHRGRVHSAPAPGGGLQVRIHLPLAFTFQET